MINQYLRLLVMTSGLISLDAMAETLAPGVQQKLSSATFEVDLTRM